MNGSEKVRSHGVHLCKKTMVSSALADYIQIDSNTFGPYISHQQAAIGSSTGRQRLGLANPRFDQVLSNGNKVLIGLVTVGLESLWEQELGFGNEVT